MCLTYIQPVLYSGGTHSAVTEMHKWVVILCKAFRWLNWEVMTECTLPRRIYICKCTTPPRDNISSHLASGRVSYLPLLMSPHRDCHFYGDTQYGRTQEEAPQKIEDTGSPCMHTSLTSPRHFTTPVYRAAHDSTLPPGDKVISRRAIFFSPLADFSHDTQWPHAQSVSKIVNLGVN